MARSDDGRDEKPMQKLQEGARKFLARVQDSRSWSFLRSNRQIGKPLLIVGLNAALSGLLLEVLPHEDCLARWSFLPLASMTALALLAAASFAFLAHGVGVRAHSRSAPLGFAITSCGWAIAFVAAVTLPACSVYWSALPPVVSACPFSVVALTSGAISTVIGAASVRSDWFPTRVSRRVVRGFASLGLLAVSGSLWNAALWYGMDETLVGTWSGWQVLRGPIATLSTFCVGYLAILQAAESADAPPLADGRVQYPNIAALLSKEADWLKLRRRALGQPDRLDAHGRPTDLVGLALSGGGIRSATISLGFMQELAATRHGPGTVFDRFDYLSTVSGGGWAGGAVTARTAAGPACHADIPGFHLRDSAWWDRLVRIVRSRSDYLIPGGPGLTMGTARPVVIVLVGSGLNLACLYACFGAFIGILVHSQRYDGFLFRMLRFASTHLPLGHLFVDATSRIGTELYTINVVCAAFALAAAVFAAGVLVLTAGVIFFLQPLRVAGGWIAAAGFVACLPLGLAVLAIHERTELTCVVGGIAASAIVAVYVRDKLSQLRVASLVGAVFAAGGAMLKMSSTLWDIARASTVWWSTGFERFLLAHVHLFSESRAGVVLETGLFTVAAIVLGMVVSRNETGLHGFWSGQISRAYLRRRDERLPTPDDPAHWPLSALRPTTQEVSRLGIPGARAFLGSFGSACNSPEARNTGGPHVGAPLHIVVAAVNTPGSLDENCRKRGTARFEYSPYAVGGPATGWLDTERYADGVTLAGAIATSAAAVNSQGGMSVPRWARAGLSALNFGLGVWMRNPRMGVDAQSPRFRRWPHFWAGYTLKDAMGANSELDTLVFVSDGGHHDNLGLSALVARECAVIVCLDASHDPDRNCSDLADVARLLRLDSGWVLTPGDEALAPLRPTNARGTLAERASRSAVAVFELKRTDGAARSIQLVYVKSSLLTELSVEVRQYAQANPAFPHESTVNQFFTEAQFEAYRLVGRQLARQAVHALRRILPGEVLASDEFTAAASPTPPDGDPLVGSGRAGPPASNAA